MENNRINSGIVKLVGGCGTLASGWFRHQRSAVRIKSLF